tara:strand:- start:392 stop:853 length:462 start_codon:yes stop_codon:yes gene_type:complete
MKKKTVRGEKAKPMTAAELKAAGKAKLKAGRSNRKSSLASIKSIGKSQRIEGRDLKKKGREVKRAVNKSARVTKRESKPKRRVVTKGKTNSGAKVKTVVVKKKDGTVKRSRSVVSGKGIKRNVVDSRRPNKGNGKMRRQVRKVYKKTGTLPSL